MGQAPANLSAFAVAVTFSFFVNARVTFKSSATFYRYLAYVSFMGALAFGIGWLGAKVEFPPIYTLVLFTLVSLFAGFSFSRYIVFLDEAP